HMIDFWIFPLSTIWGAYHFTGLFRFVFIILYGHSHVSLLINMGFSVLVIGGRVGHEAEKITYRYAHLFPTVQTEMAEKLELERMTKEDSNGKSA
ncbi:hypothetical protein NE674_17505, partial [Extibacter muris]|nr:hypothetical protein [Extibacter muris]MCQ4694922.1 hypothetical protein [Extibacter muris]